MLDEALDSIWRQGTRICPHAVHPRHAHRRIALTIEEIDVWVKCAMCGEMLSLTKEVTNA
jgi:hypothetical protein